MPLSLDAGYEKLGKVAGDSTTDKEWRKTIGLDDLDRRTLYAIASNQGGQFSSTEASAARSVLASQESEAMMAADRTGKDFAPRFKALIDLYDSVSDEEKGSLRWAQARASAQTAYEWRMRDEGRVAENVDSGNLIVSLFVRAYNELSATNDPSQDVRNMTSWIKALDLWHLQNEINGGLSWTI